MKAKNMRRFTDIRHDRWTADRWQVMLAVNVGSRRLPCHMRIAVGAEVDIKKQAETLRHSLECALAAVVRAEMEPAKRLARLVEPIAGKWERGVNDIGALWKARDFARQILGANAPAEARRSRSLQPDVGTEV